MKSLRILVAEDDAIIAMLLGELLVGMGHEVCETATNQRDAVAAATLHKPDLMIVDGGLRQGSGVAAVAEILLSGPLPHIFVSGDTRRIKAQRAQAVVLPKQFRPADLARAIETALGTVVH